MDVTRTVLTDVLRLYALICETVKPIAFGEEIVEAQVTGAVFIHTLRSVDHAGTAVADAAVHL